MGRDTHDDTMPSQRPGSEHRSTRRSLLGMAASGAMALALSGVAPGSARQGTPAPGSGQVTVYPPHDTWTASPDTEISFRGITAERLGAVYVTGSSSGGHSGVMAPHGDGNGVSFLPDKSFAPGEVVTVEARGLPEPGSGPHAFGIARPVAWTVPPETRETNAPEEEPRAFRSRPDLRPPAIEITTPASDVAPGLVCLGAKIGGGQNGAMILDAGGELVWFGLPTLSTSLVNELRVQEFRGKPVLTWAEGATPGPFGVGHFVIADGSYQRIAEFRVGNGFEGGDHHEFLLTRRGTALVIIYNAIEWDLSPAGGARHGAAVDGVIQEIEVETGRVLFEWHSLDHIPVEETRIGIGSIQEQERPFDYIHFNSIEEDPDGNLILSARHTFAIYKIDRVSGEVLWRLNGNRSDFAMGEGTPFAWQHDARLHANGELTLFDNRESDQDLADEAWSRGLVLALDEEAMTATLVREYIHPTEILSTSQGNVQVLPNGNVFVGWGSAPVFSEFTADGELVFNGRFPPGGNSYRAYRYEWVGAPSEPPAIVAERAGGSITVYASWNGATEVATWRVAAGTSADDLAEIATSERTGFETAIEVETDARFVEVEALDAAGTALGVSGPIEVGEAG